MNFKVASYDENDKVYKERTKASNDKFIIISLHLSKKKSVIAQLKINVVPRKIEIKIVWTIHSKKKCFLMGQLKYTMNKKGASKSMGKD